MGVHVTRDDTRESSGGTEPDTTDADEADSTGLFDDVEGHEDEFIWGDDDGGNTFTWDDEEP